MDPFRKVQTGDRIEGIPRDLYNGIIDLLKGGGKPGPFLQSFKQAGIIDILNNSGEDVDEFSILGLDEPLILPADNLTEFKQSVEFKGVTPTADHAHKFAVLLEPLVDQAIGKAVVAGVAICKVSVPSSLSTHAAPIVGDTTKMLTSATGSARILWAEETGTERWAIVRISEGGAGTSVFHGFKAADGDLYNLSDTPQELIQWDTTLYYDTDGYLADSSKVVIPAGLAGTYRMSIWWHAHPNSAGFSAPVIESKINGSFAAEPYRQWLWINGEAGVCVRGGITFDRVYAEADEIKIVVYDVIVGNTSNSNEHTWSMQKLD